MAAESIWRPEQLEHDNTGHRDERHDESVDRSGHNVEYARDQRGKEQNLPRAERF
jgi:hypothetical protein